VTFTHFCHMEKIPTLPGCPDCDSLNIAVNEQNERQQEVAELMMPEHFNINYKGFSLYRMLPEGVFA
jgi:hypothetical protein